MRVAPDRTELLGAGHIARAVHHRLRRLGLILLAGAAELRQARPVVA